MKSSKEIKGVPLVKLSGTKIHDYAITPFTVTVSKEDNDKVKVTFGNIASYYAEDFLRGFPNCKFANIMGEYWLSRTQFNKLSERISSEIKLNFATN